jgi:hypothetical protein
MKKEKVYSVEIFWEIPISGMADYENSPHFFDALEDEVLESDSICQYNLIPLNEETANAVLRKRELWYKWQTLNEEGSIEDENYPILSGDKEEYENLKKLIDNYLYSNSAKAFVKKGVFTNLENAKNINFSTYTVEWI